jgi:hypothetical protein
MEPLTFSHSFPFVPADVLCRIHDCMSRRTPVAGQGTTSAVPGGAPPEESRTPGAIPAPPNPAGEWNEGRR